MTDVWLGTIQKFIWCPPFKATDGGPVVQVRCMFEGEFPPRLRDAGIMPHGLTLVHERTNDSLCAAILLMNMRRAWNDLDPSFFEHVDKSE